MQSFPVNLSYNHEHRFLVQCRRVLAMAVIQIRADAKAMQVADKTANSFKVSLKYQADLLFLTINTNPAESP